MVGEGEGTEDELSRAHRDRLLRCDGALVYYGQSSKPWVEMKVMDLMQAPGWGRTRALAAKAVYVADDGDRRKRRFRTRLAEVIHGEAGGAIYVRVLDLQGGVGQAATIKGNGIDIYYDPAQPAFYYVRVLQIPTARHSLLDALALGRETAEGYPDTIQERAYSSPIWVQ